MDVSVIFFRLYHKENEKQPIPNIHHSIYLTNTNHHTRHSWFSATYQDTMTNIPVISESVCLSDGSLHMDWRNKQGWLD